MVRNRVFPWVLAAGLGTALIWSLGGRSQPSRPDAFAAPVLQRLRSLGELHTARFEYTDVVDHGTYQQPQGWLASVPGADSIARATTTNSALVRVRGSVEAGVDLSKLEAQTTPAGLKLRLPAPKAYAPDVDANLFAVRRSAFWRDDSVTLGAVAEAKARLSEAARRQGLLEQARMEAEKRVRTLAESLGTQVASIEFVGK